MSEFIKDGSWQRKCSRQKLKDIAAKINENLAFEGNLRFKV